MGAIKVRELNKYIKKYVAMDYFLSNVDVEGEVSNLTKHVNGNYYLTLKDESSSIRAVVYYTDVDGLYYDPVEGDSIIANGAISVFERDAAITFFIRQIKANGFGNVREAYERLKEKLEKEGLFSGEKKKLKAFPNRVGVVTSKTGAAIEDIINVLSRRNPSVQILLYPSLVQGSDAADNILEGLKYMEKSDVDAVIVGRGGGAYEDLVAFNDERIARYIYSMKKPVISAVGHEIDYVISDFVADLRAPTPSSAAELVSASREELMQHLEISFNTIKNLTLEKLKYENQNLNYENKNINQAFFKKIESERKELNYLKRYLEKSSAEEFKLFELNSMFTNLNRLMSVILESNKKEMKSAIAHLKLTPIEEGEKLYELGRKLSNLKLEDRFLEHRRYLEALNKRQKKDVLESLSLESQKIQNLHFKAKLTNLKNRVSMNESALNYSMNKIILKQERLIGDYKNELMLGYKKLSDAKFSDIYAKDESGSIVSSVSKLKLNQTLKVYFRDGRASARVFEIEEKDNE